MPSTEYQLNSLIPCLDELILVELKIRQLRLKDQYIPSTLQQERDNCTDRLIETAHAVGIIKLVLPE